MILWKLAIFLAIKLNNLVSGTLGSGADRHCVGVSCLCHHGHRGHHQPGHEHHRAEPYHEARQGI